MFDFYISLFRSIKNANFMISPYLPPNLCSKSVEQLPIKIDMHERYDWSGLWFWFPKTNDYWSTYMILRSFILTRSETWQPIMLASMIILREFNIWIQTKIGYKADGAKDIFMSFNENTWVVFERCLEFIKMFSWAKFFKNDLSA